MKGETQQSRAAKAGAATELDGARSNGRLLLASGSPRRRELIGLTGWPVDTRPARADETPQPGETGPVLTSIAVRAPDGTVLVDTCESSVPMRRYGDDEIERYLAGGSPFDKAGGYGIQDGLFEPVDMWSFHDCFANVMGLPLCHVVRTL